MTKYLFFCGKGKTESEAAFAALGQCSEAIIKFPSLVVELVEMVPNALGYDAHLRIAAISDEIGTKKIKAAQSSTTSSQIKPKDDLGRRNGVEHAVGFLNENTKLFTLTNFDLAAKDGVVLDIPIQDLDQFKGLGMSVEEVRDRLHDRQEFFEKKFDRN